VHEPNRKEAAFLDGEREAPARGRTSRRNRAPPTNAVDRVVSGSEEVTAFDAALAPDVHVLELLPGAVAEDLARHLDVKCMFMNL
jgi:hypothetical protein